MKLTFSYAAIGLAMALVAIPARDWREWVLRPVWLAIGGAAGAASLSGYWWVIEWRRWGNPLFPLMNTLFHSPYALNSDYVDPTFLPHSAGRGIRAPWIWALHMYRPPGPVAGPRSPLRAGRAGSLLCLAQAAWRAERPYRGRPELNYPFHDKALSVTTCGRVCFNQRKINLSQVFAGQTVGVEQVDERIWLVSFMHYDLGYFDDETCRLEPLQNPSVQKCYPCLRIKRHSCVRNGPASFDRLPRIWDIRDA